MEKLFEGLASVLTGLGLPGVIIGAAGYAIWYLFDKLQASQNLRIAESREMIKTIESNTDQLGRFQELLNATATMMKAAASNMKDKPQ